MPTLTQPAIGSTAWGTQMNTNLQVLQSQLTNAMQGRIARVTATQIALQRYTGDTVEVNGLNVSIGSSGLTLNTTDNLIDNAGANTGAAMVVNGGANPAVYYVYVSNANASYAASSLRASSSAPVSVNGVRYLNNSGNGANWRFVGYVRTIDDGAGHPNFVDSATQRFVINYYNRRVLPLSVTESAASWTWNGGWHQANANSTNKVETICNGEDGVVLTVNCTSFNGTQNGVVGIGVDSTAANSAAIVTFGPAGPANCPVQAMYNAVPGEGYHAFNWLEQSPLGGAITYFSTNYAGVSASGLVGLAMG